MVLANCGSQEKTTWSTCVGPHTPNTGVLLDSIKALVTLASTAPKATGFALTRSPRDAILRAQPEQGTKATWAAAGPFFTAQRRPGSQLANRSQLTQSDRKPWRWSHAPRMASPPARGSVWKRLYRISSCKSCSAATSVVFLRKMRALGALV